MLYLKVLLNLYQGTIVLSKTLLFLLIQQNSISLYVNCNNFLKSSFHCDGLSHNLIADEIPLIFL